MRKNKRKAMKNRRRIMLRSALCLVLTAGICTTVYIVHIRTEQRAVEEREQAAKESTDEDEWVDLKLTYLGSAKVSRLDGIDTTWVDMPKRMDGNVEYTTEWFNILSDYSTYKIEDQWFGFYDADFDVETTLVKKQRTRYVMVYGRKLLWMQYRTKENSWGAIPTRIGVDWNEELNEYTEYFYEFEYSQIENGVLADMTAEYIN